MIGHIIGENQELIPVWACDHCHSPIVDLDYAEVIWQDAKVGSETLIRFGHTKCTRVFDTQYPNNMTAKEYLEKLI